jgi:hypothetical protein
MRCFTSPFAEPQAEAKLIHGRFKNQAVFVAVVELTSKNHKKQADAVLTAG